MVRLDDERDFIERVSEKAGILPGDVEAVLEVACEEIGWLEIHAFDRELRRGQCIREDAGGFMIRCIRRLFGLPSPLDEVTTYRQAARVLLDTARQQRSAGS